MTTINTICIHKKLFIYANWIANETNYITLDI